MVLTVSNTPPFTFFVAAGLCPEFLMSSLKEGEGRRIKPRTPPRVKGSTGRFGGAASKRSASASRHGADDDDRLRHRRLVGQAYIEPRRHAGRRQLLEPLQRPAGEQHPRLSRGQVDDAEVTPVDASPKAGAERLRARFLGGEAARIARRGMDARLALAALVRGEHAIEKAFAEALDHLLEAADVDQIAAEADDH